MQAKVVGVKKQKMGQLRTGSVGGGAFGNESLYGRRAAQIDRPPNHAKEDDGCGNTTEKAVAPELLPVDLKRREALFLIDSGRVVW